jgi:hypothetical protein
VNNYLLMVAIASFYVAVTLISPPPVVVLAATLLVAIALHSRSLFLLGGRLDGDRCLNAKLSSKVIQPVGRIVPILHPVTGMDVVHGARFAECN